ncbi:Protease production enhancer protein [Agrobacterium sp. DSM 25558]|uniref:Protease production enhancer protein n=1 Tax=Agrobacterium rosae TaxID=1972867 RepID=A0A1R3U2Y3_9HYPH|nr:DNA-binding response regulator [Agrobacterium rosae]SCX16725.1 Protease production enhancer protein [Agrobacterium sp. DSM 25558]SCX35972.1 Protease production enhancer protein [Agrobacterium rosae]
MRPHVIRIVIVDDHPIFRSGLSRSLEDEPGFEVVGEGASAADAISLFDQHRPDIMLLDLSMPGGGHSALHVILRRDAAASVIVLTASGHDSDIAQALAEGAKGYVLKGVGVSELVNVISTVAADDGCVASSSTRNVMAGLKTVNHPAQVLATLTPREEQILELVAAGNSNKEIARLLSLQEKTIKHNMTRILQKLKLRNRTEAAIYLREARSKG